MPALVGPASGRTSTSRKPCLLAPCGKVGAREVKRVAELDQHVERHEEAERVFAAGVVDDVLDDDVGPALRQRVVGRLDELLLPLEVPAVEDQSHRYDVGLG